MKKQFTISDPDFATLDRVAQSCGLTHSQVLSQYIRRYSVNLEQLLSTSGNLEQPAATNGNFEQPKSAMSATETAESCSEVAAQKPKKPGKGLDAMLATEF